MQRVILTVVLMTMLQTTAIQASAMLVAGADENNIPGDCRATAQALVALAQQRAKLPPPELHELAAKLLAEKNYRGTFGSREFIAPFYVGMILQSPPEVDQFMATATPDQLRQMEEEEEIDCIKQALIDLSRQPEKPEPPKPPLPPAAASSEQRSTAPDQTDGPPPAPQPPDGKR